MEYKTVAFTSKYDRSSFSCGKAPLDSYLKTQLSQDINKRLCAGFILPDGETIIKGYYTLASASIPKSQVPKEVSKKFPYPDLPATLIGRLAVNKSYMGQGLGELILMDALHRSFMVSESQQGSIAVIVDPIDDEATRFYKKYDFIALSESKRLFLPMATINELFK
jgi:ribosomal protein S18 acetylase RimI-like enzyme